MRKNMMFFGLVLLILSTAGFSKGDARDYFHKYRVTKGDETRIIEYQFKTELMDETREKRVVLTTEEGLSELTIVPNQGLKSRRNCNEKEKIDLTAVKLGNVIQVKGLYKGKVIDKDFKIDAPYWYQALDYSVTEFVNTGRTSQTFWMLSELKMEPQKFVFKREDEETVEIGRDKFEAIKVRLTVPGIKAAFWGADYWVRKADGLFIKFQGLKGPPGSPQVVIEWMGEE